MKIKTWPKEELRRRERAFIRKSLPQLASIIAVGVITGTIISLAWDGQARAFVLGAGTVGIAWAIWATVALGSGSINQRFGHWGEDATRTQLKKLRMFKWRLVQGLEKVGGGDIDGVAVGPSGIFVVESKWRNDAPKAEFMQSTRSEYAKQARTNANIVQNFLMNEGIAIDVQPVVVVWGPGTKGVALVEGVHDGVAIVHGLDLLAWLRSHQAVVDRAQKRSISRKLKGRADKKQPL